MTKASPKPKPGPRIKVITPKTQIVRIEFSGPGASNVCIAGTFNDWHPSVTGMIALGNGRWAKELALPPGTYEYRLVVDGAWMVDPHATEHTPNPFGGLNAIVRVLPDGDSGGLRQALATKANPTDE